ncbi:MAG: Unknown protein [uncultured Aureispira sp.]|uniref:Uncharacterized protein n=1 Tax=uncultured Aureispira sp. TaxID=1331704 RepID=A0A6S6S7J3_9BACT|nr:MAG: Unknown protein [uncultured Aureispira sp.]
MKLKNVQLLYTGHLVASILLFFIGLIYLRSLQTVLVNIEITGFDPIAYDAPTYNFAQIAVFFCALTIFVGYKTQVKLPLIGVCLVGNGFVFLGLALILFLLPRYWNLYDTFWYWCFYILANVVLTMLAISKYEKAVLKAPIYEDTILDDLDKL